MNKTKVLFVAGRELEYVRNSVITRSLKNSYQLTCITDDTKNVLLRYLKIYLKIFRMKRDYEITFVGFYGTPFMIFARTLFKTKIIFDSFVSTYDTLCFDRKQIKPDSILGKLLFQIDRRSLNNANHILVDTNENKKYLHETFKVANEKISRVFVSCDETLFKYDKTTTTQKIILFYSTYQPLHGTLNIIKAAKIIEQFSNYAFHIYGKGQELADCIYLSRKFSLKNVFFFDYVKYADLPSKISEAEICLAGPFGSTPKAKRVITGKTYQFLCKKKPVIVTNTVANRELLTPGFDAEFCESANSASLARSIMKLIEDKDYRLTIANNGYSTYIQRASNLLIHEQIVSLISNL